MQGKARHFIYMEPNTTVIQGALQEKWKTKITGFLKKEDRNNINKNDIGNNDGTATRLVESNSE